MQQQILMSGFVRNGPRAHWYLRRRKEIQKKHEEKEERSRGKGENTERHFKHIQKTCREERMV